MGAFASRRRLFCRFSLTEQPTQGFFTQLVPFFHTPSCLATDHRHDLNMVHTISSISAPPPEEVPANSSWVYCLLLCNSYLTQHCFSHTVIHLVVTERPLWGGTRSPNLPVQASSCPAQPWGDAVAQLLPEGQGQLLFSLSQPLLHHKHAFSN